jgi:regulatory protein
VARTICLRQLDRRARTRAELAETLRRRGVPDEAARTVLDRFTEVVLIDDAALADVAAMGLHRERGLARRAIVARLRQRGVGEAEVRAAIEPIDGDSERAAARTLAEKKLRSLNVSAPAAALRRLVGLLGRKGYPAGLAYEVSRSVLGEAFDADPPRDDPTEPDIAMGVT